METVGLWQLAEEQQPYMTAMRRLFSYGTGIIRPGIQNKGNAL